MVAEGVPVIDLVPHAPDTTPPRFRSTDGHPGWAALSPDAVVQWADDLRRMSDASDQSVREPWARG